MPDNQTPTRDYEVGYGKPPKQHQFKPGESGFKGRKKKPREQHAEMIARVRDEMVVVGGKRISKLELAVRQVFNQTIKSGKTRDLKALMDMLDQYGAIPEWDRYAEMKAGADEALRKIFETLDRTLPDGDPADHAERAKQDRIELDIVMECEHCGPTLRNRWKLPSFMELVERGFGTELFKRFKATEDG